MSETAMETLNLVAWDHRFELSMYCMIRLHQIGLMSYKFESFVFCVGVDDEALW